MDADKNTTQAPKRRRRAGGIPFPKGYSGNPSGRPKGAKNHATLEAKDFARQLVDSEAYRSALAQRLTAGTAGSMEALLWSYGYGKPVERVETGGPGAFADVSDEELRKRLAAALGKL
jgi:hypothetical protein